MAKISETLFSVKISRLVRETENLNEKSEFDALTKTIEEIVQELVTDTAIVEVTQI